MPFPPFFRRLFGDNPVKPYKIRKELLPLDVDVVETFRKSLIGCLIPTTMATLPSCLGIPDGSLFLFEDYPELKEKYDAGGFNGMLLESTATSEEKDAWRGKWIKHPQGLGLYAPRLQGLFLRNAGGPDSQIGAYQQDAVQTGITKIYSRLLGNLSSSAGPSGVYGNVSNGREFDSTSNVPSETSGSGYVFWENLQRTASETRPSNVTISYGIYLGRTA